MKEEWKNIPGWEGYYQASNFGRIKSVNRTVLGRDGVIQNKREKILIQITNEQGRYKVNLCRGAIKKTYKVHTLVALAFLGEKPEDKVVCHNDGNHQNNKPSNLRYDTLKGNQADRKKHGTHYEGSSLSWALLDEEKVKTIKAKIANGISRIEIANEYHVTKGTIAQICLDKNWRHVPWPEGFKPTKSKKKLTVDLANDIRQRRKNGTPAKSLAEEYKVSLSTIWFVVNNIYYVE